MRDFKKIKEIGDYTNLDAPELVDLDLPNTLPDTDTMMYLRMLVRPKYGQFIIPEELSFLKDTILSLAEYDAKRTGIKDSWCYVTVRHGEVTTKTDDEWHFDGSSFRTDIIPERNYIWASHTPTEYKVGELEIPSDFEPNKYNLFTFAAHQLRDEPVLTANEKTWYLISPFCLHRRPKITNTNSRTFYRICFTDIEGRDINNTQNPLLYTEFFGRNPVMTFRNGLLNYYEKKMNDGNKCGF